MDDPSLSLAVFARKVIRIRAGWNKETQLHQPQNEFAILNRLKHGHIVSVLDIYQYKSRLNIIMGEVADTDLAEYLFNVDGLANEDPGKNSQRTIMVAWPRCLIQAIDYLHEMKVKHKDIKPANILIMNGHVLLADFGIWKDLIDQETTASLNSNGDIGTRMYGAPEVLSENHRRGRAADIYSLGCVFLELSTVLVGSQNSLEKWSRHRELSGTRLYSASASEILNRMRYLWASYVAQERTFADQWRPPVSQNDSMAWLGLATADRSFLTLDPNPRTQITARQMVAKLQRPDSRFLNLIQRKSCDTCRAFPDSFNPNLPLHSLYKYDMPENLLFDPDEVLHLEISSTWEEAKRSRLQTHMWW